MIIHKSMVFDDFIEPQIFGDDTPTDCKVYDNLISFDANGVPLSDLNFIGDSRFSQVHQPLGNNVRCESEEYLRPVDCQTPAELSKFAEYLANNVDNSTAEYNDLVNSVDNSKSDNNE